MPEPAKHGYKNERGTTKKGNFQLTIYKEVSTQPCRQSRKLETQHRQTTGRRISTWLFLDFYVEVIPTQVDGTAILASQMLPEVKRHTDKFNPFQTNGICHKATYNKVRMVHYI